MNGWAITHADLTRYRVVYAAVMLLILPSFTWVADVPDPLFRPPPGPLRLLDGFPAAPVMAGLGLVLALSLAALLVGRWVTPASWIATATMLTGYGITYSLGKIDHGILMVLTPVVLSAAGWAPGGVVRPWVMRLWAFAIGTAMLTAGLAKLAGGWLDPHTHAVQGFVFQQVYSFNLTGWLGAAVTHVTWPWFWEPMDWAAVALECGLIVFSLVGLRSFRIGLALLALFHVGVLVMMNITFTGNVLVYGGFVAWGAVRWWPRTVNLPAWAGLAAGVTWWAVVEEFGNAGEVVGPAVLFGGAAVGLWHLAVTLWRRQAALANSTSAGRVVSSDLRV